jgi:hypothetical protein
MRATDDVWHAMSFQRRAWFVMPQLGHALRRRLRTCHPALLTARRFDVKDFGELDRDRTIVGVRGH